MAAQNKEYSITSATTWTKIVDNEAGACTLVLKTHETPVFLAATATDAEPTGTYAEFPLYFFGDGWTNKTLATIWPSNPGNYVWARKTEADGRTAIISISQAAA